MLLEKKMDIHTFGYESGGSEVVWDVRDIWKAVKDLPTIEISTRLFKRLGDRTFKNYNEDDMLRVREADLSYPIIIPTSAIHTGDFIIDGFHRLYRHLELKHPLTPVKALDKMPRPLYCKGKPFKIKGLEFDWYDPRHK